MSAVMLFDRTITDLKSWSGVFQDKSLFTPLAREIFAQAGLSFPGLEGCTPGSNAVFRAGNAILKIFAPAESGIGGEGEFLAETYGLTRAASLGVPAPKVLASGVIRDRYVFHWLLLERVEGTLLAHAAGSLTHGQWHSIGSYVRQLVERLDGPCRAFSGKPLRSAAAEARWMLFPGTFQQERLALLEELALDPVFVHGDLNADNLILTPEGQPVLIDFADCRAAPFETELAALVCDGFRFPGGYLQGFVGEADRAALVEALVRGLLLHDYGAWIIRDRIAPPGDVSGISGLKAAVERSLSCCLNR